MEKSSVEAIANTLNAAAVRYLIAGGLAVVAHGYVRFTADLDVIIDLEPANVGRAVAALSQLGYQPRAPVGLSEFADPKKRAMWVREKGSSTPIEVPHGWTSPQAFLRRSSDSTTCCD